MLTLYFFELKPGILWKIYQIFHVIFETTSQFFLNFASFFNVMRDNSAVLSWLKRYMVFTKGAHQSAKYQKNFNCLGEFHQICTLVGSFCWKYITFQLKQVQRSYASWWYWRLMQNLNKNQFFVSKLTRIWWILMRALKSLQHFHFDLSL